MARSKPRKGRLEPPVQVKTNMEDGGEMHIEIILSPEEAGSLERARPVVRTDSDGSLEGDIKLLWSSAIARAFQQFETRITEPAPGTVH